MKKILSIILAAAMLIGLAPTAFAATTDIVNDAEGFWLFTGDSHGKTGLAYDLTNNVSAFQMEDTNTAVSDKWEFVNEAGGSSYTVKADHFDLYGSGVPNPISALRAAVFELDVDFSGSFIPSVSYLPITSGAKWEVYLMEKPANAELWHCETPVEGSTINNLNNPQYQAQLESIDQTKRLGIIDTYGTGTAIRTEAMRQINVNKGRYYLVFIANGVNENWDKTTSVARINLVSFALGMKKAASARPTLDYLINSDAFAVAYNDLRYVDAHIAYDDGWLATTPSVDTNMNFVTCISWKKQLTKKYDGSSIVACDPYTVLDLKKTSPYQIENHIHNGPAVVMNMDNYAIYGTLKSGYYGKANPAERPYLAVRINVPAAGKYRIETWSKYSQIANYKNTAVGSAMKVYFGKAPADPASSVTDLKTYVNSNINNNLVKYDFIGWHDTSNDGSATPGEYVAFETNEEGSDIINVPSAGEYYVVFMADSDSLTRNPNCNSDTYKTQWFALSGIKLTPVDDEGQQATDNNYDAIVNVDAGNGKEIATTIENAEVKAVAADINGAAIENGAIIPSETVAVGSSYTANAPEIDDYTFLYWAKGIGKNRKIVSHNESYSFKVTSGGTLLMAVYAKNESAGSVAMFYNGNGQLLATQTGATYTAPALPSMAGFGTATHWALAGSGEEISAGATGEISGEMNFVAQYGELKTVNVTVENGNGGGEVAYGSDVTVTATERKNGNGAELFNYWENENGEILSFDLSYTFKALKNTTVKAIYREYKPNKSAIKKIVVTNDGKNVFAEFVGIDNVIERGILFGENATLGNYTAKVTMVTDAEEFTAYNDLEGEPKAIGYAILAGGKVIYSK